jgi:GxxExxY protein
MLANQLTDTLKHRRLTDKILRTFYDVYNELGHGFLESVYEEAIAIAFAEAGLVAARQVPIPVWFRGRSIGEYRADILVNDSVLIELKVAKCLDESHFAQLMHYLRATKIEVGMLLNFGPHPDFKRLVFENSRKGISEHPRKSAVGLSQ